MTKGRVLEVNERKTSQGKPIFDVNVQEGNETKKYQCWDDLRAKQGQEIEYEVVPPPAGTNYTPTMKIPKSGGGKGGGYKADPANLAMMELSYKKDIMCKCVDIALAVSGRSDKHLDEKEISKMSVECYRVIGLPLFKHEEQK